MSRRAIISDVHSNLLALDAVLADIQQQQVDAIVCLGDICGYGPQPTECIDRVRSVALWTLMGNHDEALFVDPKDFGKNARLAIEWQKRVLEPGLESTQVEEERWYWLQNLSPRRLEGEILFVHASPREPLYEYVLREDFLDTGMGPSEKALDLFRATKWLCFCGHSHRPGVVAEDYQWFKPEELNDSTYVLKQGVKTIINVGSVGQPRDGNTAACYCIFDLPDSAAASPAAQAAPSQDVPVVAEDAETVPLAPPLGAVLESSGLSNVGSMDIGTDAKTPPSEALTKTVKTLLAGRNAGGSQAAARSPEHIGMQDETRTSDELQKARENVILNLPRVTFRRIPYDVAAAQALFRAVPELPDSNAVRLAQGR